MANGDFDYRKFLTGIDPAGGGKDLFGREIPGLIPGGGALSGLGQVAGGIADIASANKDFNRAKDQRRKAEERRQKARAGLDAFEFDVSQAQRDLATAGIRPTDLSPMQSLQATELAALSTDPRALMGGLGASTARAQRATLAAQQADLGRELTAMQGLADLEQGALEKKQQLQLGLLEGDRQLALADRAQARQNMEAARQAKRAGAMGVVGGLTNIGIAAATGGMGPTIPFGTGGAGFNVANSTTATGEVANPNLYRSAADYEDMYSAYGGGLGDTSDGSLSEYETDEKGGRVKYGHGGKMNEDVIIAILEEGGMNAPVTKLEGEFDHSTNKKAIIDEETGVKEAEATGGEYILNPEQGEEISMAYKGIEQIVDSGEEPTMDQLMALYEAVRNVFSQPQFNEA
jgi:hypothetical protein